VHVVLVEPQIAPNTGSIIRLCANTGAELHLVGPLGFAFDDARLRRGGLDYHEFATVTLHVDVQAARDLLPGRWFAFSAGASIRYTDVEYEDNDVVVFGTERTGLCDDVLHDRRNHEALTIPMRPWSRSINLANAVSIVVYEAWRQQGFDGAGPREAASMLAVEALGETADPI
jgi:tRNA (cytidine/uridine-2'-O-)-methyltransferase